MRRDGETGRRARFRGVWPYGHESSTLSPGTFLIPPSHRFGMPIKNKTLLITLFLFIISFFPKFSLMYKGPLHGDALNLAIQSKASLDTGQLIYQHGTGYPLATIISASFIWLAERFSIHAPVIAINFMNVFFSSLGTSLLFLFLQQIFDRKTAVFSCIIILLNPLLLHMSLYGHSQWLSLFFMIAGYLFFFRYLRCRGSHPLILSAICFGFNAAARLQDFLPCLIPVLFAFFFSPERDQKAAGLNPERNDQKTIGRDAALFFIVFVLTTLPFYIPMFHKIYTGADAGYYHEYFGPWMMKSFHSFSLIHLRNQMVYLFKINSLPGSLAALIGLGILFKKRPRLGIVFCLQIFIPILIGAGLLFSKPRHFLPSLLFFTVLTGYFLGHFLNKKPWLNRSVATAVFIALGINLSWAYPYIQLNHNHDFLGGYYRWISTITEPNACIMVHSPFRLLVKHYANRQPLPIPVSKRLSPADKHRLQVSLDKKLNNHIPVYIPLLGLHGHLKGFGFEDFLLQNYTLVFVGENLISDWHVETIKPNVFNNPLYRITKSSDKK